MTRITIDGLDELRRDLSRCWACSTELCPSADPQDLCARHFFEAYRRVTDTIVHRLATSTGPDAYTERFDLERTEQCWRDGCNEDSDPKSETGLCSEHRDELRGRWKSES